MTSPLIVIPPQRVTDSMLIGTDVTEADYAAYSSGTTYALGDRVIVTTGDHSIYESLVAGNLAHAPATSSDWWVRVGPTNRWALFDNSNSTSTSKSTNMSYTLTPALGINAFALLNLVGATSLHLQVTHPSYGTIYDKTTNLASLPVAPGWWEWFFGARNGPSVATFLDLPGIMGSTLIVDLSGTTELSVGVMVFGQQQAVGLGVLQGARIGTQDYSRVETNDFGDTVLVQRAYAKRSSFKVPIPAEQVDSTLEFLSQYRASPVLWIGTKKYAGTVIYGFYKDFDMALSYDAVSELDFDIQGLT